MTNVCVTWSCIYGQSVLAVEGPSNSSSGISSEREIPEIRGKIQCLENAFVFVLFVGGSWSFFLITLTLLTSRMKEALGGASYVFAFSKTFLTTLLKIAQQVARENIIM